MSLFLSILFWLVVTVLSAVCIIATIFICLLITIFWIAHKVGDVEDMDMWYERIDMQ